MRRSSALSAEGARGSWRHAEVTSGGLRFLLEQNGTSDGADNVWTVRMRSSRKKDLLLTVVDTETTGISDRDQVMEIACLDDPDTFISTLVCPTCHIDHAARAAHHITDNELMTAPLASSVQLLIDRAIGDVMVCHNLAFDVKMIEQTWPGITLPVRRICTWRSALHLYPSAQAHNLQYLRYYLNLHLNTKQYGLPHRALCDAFVTWHVLQRMLQTNSLESLIELTNRPVLLRTIRFGKHSGSLWSDVPKDYLKWVLQQDFDEDTKHTAWHHLDA